MKLFKGIFGITGEAVKPQAKEVTLTGEVGISTGDNGEFQGLASNAAIDPSILYAVCSNNINVTNTTESDSAEALDLASVSQAQTQAQASVPVSTQPRDQDPTLLESAPPSLAPAQTPPPVLASDPASALPDQNLNNPIIESIRILVDSIFTKDDADPLKNYFFSIFMPPADPEDIKEKLIASTHSPAPTITPAQETELRETLQKCADACIYDTDLPPSDPSTPQSNPTKTTSTSSPTLKEKAEPPVYFGVGIKTTLEDIEDQKFLKITDIFDNSNLRKEKQGNEDYTNQFITHLNCKLGNDTEAREYSINDIFKKFKDDNSATAQEKFDEKIDQIFRDISQTSIKFKISTDTSQADPATQPADVTVDKIIFEKTKGVYQQKKMTPPTITELRNAENAKNAETKVEGQAV